MCGLYGFLNYTGRLNNQRQLLQAMAVSASSRGTDATGFSMIDGRGRQVTHKAPLSADRFTPLNYSSVKRARAVIGHTRHTTQGNERVNANNHPFAGHTLDGAWFTLAHNGVLTNDYELRASHNLPDTTIETDTYIAVQLLEQSAVLDMAAVKRMAETVSGMFAFTILTADALWIVRNDSPLVMVNTGRALVYGSTDEIVQAGLHAAGIFRQAAKPVTAETIIRFGFNGSIEKSAFTSCEAAWYGHYSSARVAAGGYNVKTYKAITPARTFTKRGADNGGFISTYDRWMGLYENASYQGYDEDEVDFMVDEVGYAAVSNAAANYTLDSLYCTIKYDYECLSR